MKTSGTELSIATLHGRVQHRVQSYRLLNGLSHNLRLADNNVVREVFVRGRAPDDFLSFLLFLPVCININEKQCFIL
jgi:hypothetical protein